MFREKAGRHHCAGAARHQNDDFPFAQARAGGGRAHRVGGCREQVELVLFEEGSKIGAVQQDRELHIFQRFAQRFYGIGRRALPVITQAVFGAGMGGGGVQLGHKRAVAELAAQQRNVDPQLLGKRFLRAVHVAFAVRGGDRALRHLLGRERHGPGAAVDQKKGQAVCQPLNHLPAGRDRRPLGRDTALGQQMAGKRFTVREKDPFLLQKRKRHNGQLFGRGQARKQRNAAPDLPDAKLLCVKICRRAKYLPQAGDVFLHTAAQFLVVFHTLSHLPCLTVCPLCGVCKQAAKNAAPAVQRRRFSVPYCSDAAVVPACLARESSISFSSSIKVFTSLNWR